MSKPLKSKKDRVPKITEEEYAAYLSSLRESSGQSSAVTADKKMQGEERET